MKTPEFNGINRESDDDINKDMPESDREILQESLEYNSLHADTVTKGLAVMEQKIEYQKNLQNILGERIKFWHQGFEVSDTERRELLRDLIMLEEITGDVLSLKNSRLKYSKITKEINLVNPDEDLKEEWKNDNPDFMEKNEIVVLQPKDTVDKENYENINNDLKELNQKYHIVLNHLKDSFPEEYEYIKERLEHQQENRTN